jgi:uncharacterized protein YndB with AHSA1/START domain
MKAAARRAAAPPDHVLALTRTFDAPRELVFRAWTDPEHAAKWWAPRGFTVTLFEMDLRPGGAWRKCMRSPEGKEYWRSGVIREVSPPERLVFSYVTDDPGTTPGQETLVTLTFEDRGGSTRMRFRQAVFESVASRDAHRGGWTSSLERLAEYLATTD